MALNVTSTQFSRETNQSGIPAQSVANLFEGSSSHSSPALFDSGTRAALGAFRCILLAAHPVAASLFSTHALHVKFNYAK